MVRLREYLESQRGHNASSNIRPRPGYPVPSFPQRSMSNRKFPGNGLSYGQYLSGLGP